MTYFRKRTFMEPNEHTYENIKITCTSIDCPERKSLCCNSYSSIAKSTRKGTRFICNKCGKDFIGGECTSSTSKPDSWEEELKELTIVMLDGKSFKELSPLIFFISSLLETEREKAYDKGWNDVCDEMTANREFENALLRGKREAVVEILKKVEEVGDESFYDVVRKEDIEDYLKSLTQE